MDKLNNWIVFELSRCLSLKAKIKLSGVCKELHRKIHYKNALGDYICLKTVNVENTLIDTIVNNKKEVTISILIKAVVDINFQNNIGNTALIDASKYGKKEVVRLLLERNDLKIDIQTILLENTVLIIASYKGNEDIVKLLLENGAKVNIQNNRGSTALMEASCKGNKKIVKLLLENGAKVNIQNNSGDTALMEVSRKGNKQIVELLLKNNPKK